MTEVGNSLVRSCLLVVFRTRTRTTLPRLIVQFSMTESFKVREGSASAWLDCQNPQSTKLSEVAKGNTTWVVSHIEVIDHLEGFRVEILPLALLGLGVLLTLL